MQSPLIALDNVSKSYGPNPVLRECTLNVARGEIVVVCGPSGSGKSTLIKCINGLEPYPSGSVMFEGKEVGARTPELPELRSRLARVVRKSVGEGQGV